MAFKFKMQALYKIRLDEEKTAKIELGLLQRKKNELLVIIDGVSKKQVEWGHKYSQSSLDANPSQRIILIEDYLIALEKRKRQLYVEVTNLEVEIVQALVKVKEAYKARRQVEIIREKQEEEYRLELKRKQGRIDSEMNTLRFIHKKADREGVVDENFA